MKAERSLPTEAPDPRRHVEDSRLAEPRRRAARAVHDRRISRVSRGLVALALVAALPLVPACKRSRGAGATTEAASGGLPVPVDDPDGPFVAEIDLSRGVPEASASGLFASEKGTLHDLLDDLQAARKKPEFSGVFVRFGYASLGWGRGHEIARALSAVRASGKPVVCQGESFGNGSYWVAAASCDEIWLAPAGGLDTIGIAAESIHAAPLLAKLGVAVDVLQIGKYKGTGEMVTRDSPSEEYKESLGSTLGDLRKQWLDGTVASRKNEEIRGLLELGPYPPQEAKTKALVDAVGYVDEARDQARRRSKAGHVDVIFGGKKRESKSGLADLVRVLSGGSRSGRRGGPPYIALLQASGAIDMEKGGSPLSSKDSGIYAKPLIKSLRQLAKDDAAKVVVMRIDSPGGSALASDLLWHEMMLVRKKKPLVISIGDMAASGGYYMACSGTKIIAEETSIIGSIGVVGGKFGLAPALKPLGINVETIPAAGAPAETHATYMSMLTPWDDGTRDSVRRSMTAIYDLFLQRVSEGRGMPVDKVQTFAEGHIFSGREAKARGMIDELGGYERAIEFARAEAKLDNDAPVRVIADQPGLLELLEGSAGDVDPAAEARRAAAPTADDVLPQPISAEWRVFASSYAPLFRGERALAVLPTVLTIR